MESEEESGEQSEEEVKVTKKRKPKAPKSPEAERMPAPTYQPGSEDLRKAFDARMDTLRHEQYEREDLSRKSAEASNAALHKSFEGVCACVCVCLYCTHRTLRISIGRTSILYHVLVFLSLRFYGAKQQA